VPIVVRPVLPWVTSAFTDNSISRHARIRGWKQSRLEAIELQDSAYPYHDWNERILAECYAPNGASRILTPERRIAKIVNNYSRISFNFGPTLLSWMKTTAPDTHRAITDGDRQSCEYFGGHGSAIAQAYSHTIKYVDSARSDRESHLRRTRQVLEPLERRFRTGFCGVAMPSREPVRRTRVSGIA